MAGSGKLARQGKASTQAQAAAVAAAVGEKGEEGRGGGAAGTTGVAMGSSVKRKRSSPPESPAPSKKRTAEEVELPRKPSTTTTSTQPPPLPSEGTPTPGKDQVAGKGQGRAPVAVPVPDPDGQGQANRKPQQLGGGGGGRGAGGGEGQQDSLTKTTIDSEAAAGSPAPSALEKDVDELQKRAGDSVENVSHGQRSSFGGTEVRGHSHPPSDASRQSMALTVGPEARSPSIPHLVPSHAGWFQWGNIHSLERSALPEYFSGKSDQKTPETYMAHRKCIMSKYRENPQTLLKFEDVQESLTGDVSGAVRLFAFLDHWGLINYQAISDFSKFLPSQQALSISMEETSDGGLQLSPLAKPALSNLFHFEAALAPGPRLVSPAAPASNVPLSSLAEAAIQESLAAPSVEYHCNSCQADCSKRRYHCQKQADFDLCPDCYSDGKFGQGMTGTDFLRMDALSGSADANGGGWSDQETLLLLEALELYGDNWSEIAEHVATKSKSQCILHFIRLPIEDPFLEEMEEPNSVTEIQPPPSTDASADDKETPPPKVSDDYQDKTPQNNDAPASSEGKEKIIEKDKEKDKEKEKEKDKEILPTSEGDGSALPQEGRKDKPSEPTSEPPTEPSSELPTVSQTTVPTTENSDPARPESKEADASKSSGKVEDSTSSKHPFIAIAEGAGCCGPDGLIAFADAGNPVMTQVAFLAAMVGPRVAAAAAQAALKSLAEEDPVGFLSAKNSFSLDASYDQDGTSVIVPSDSDRVSSGLPGATDQSVAPAAAGDIVMSDGKDDASATTEKKKDPLEKGTAGETHGEGGGAQASQKPEADTLATNTNAGQDVPSVAKVRNAAASALASAAVKAKLLADQEEREIQRLVAGVIENQLKKLELKLKHFNELEALLGKECDQAEKARAKVYAERARIMASRLGSPPSSGSQVQSTTSSAMASHSKASSSHPSTSTSQPRPAVYAFGPTGVSTPATAYKQPPSSAPESSMPVSSTGGAAASGQQQGLASQRLPKPVPGNSLASSVK